MAEAGTVAVIFPPPGGDWTPSTTSVGGLPVFTRIILTAERAGVQRFVILSGAATATLQKLLKGSKAEVVWAEGGSFQGVEALRDIPAPLFLLNGATLFDPGVLRKVAEAFKADMEVLLPQSSTPTPHPPTIALASPRLLPSLLQAIQQKSLFDWEDFLALSRASTTEAFDLPNGTLYLDASSLPIQEVEKRLYRSLGKPTDTAIIRWVRKASIPFVKGLAETSVTPNHITLAGFLIGLGSIALFLKAEYAYVLTGACLFALSFVADLIDGMLARLKLLESRKGAWIDFILDNVLHLGVFISLLQVVSIRSPGAHVRYLGGLLIGGSLLSALTFGRYLRIREDRKQTLPRSPLHHRLERLVEAIRHRDFSLTLLLFTLVDRVEWFLVVAAVGANCFWLMVLYLLLSKRLSVSHQRSASKGLSL